MKEDLKNIGLVTIPSWSEGIMRHQDVWGFIGKKKVAGRLRGFAHKTLPINKKQEAVNVCLGEANMIFSGATADQVPMFL